MSQGQSRRLSASHSRLDDNSCKEELHVKRSWAPYCEMLTFCCAPVLTTSRASSEKSSANQLLQPSLRQGGSGDVPGSAVSTELPLSCEGQPAVGGDPATWGGGGGGGGEDPPAAEASSPHRGGPASSFSRPSFARPFILWRPLFFPASERQRKQWKLWIHILCSFSPQCTATHIRKAVTLLPNRYGQGYTELVKL